MFTIPKIHVPKQTKGCTYVTFLFNGKRYREYNANRLNLDLFPNQCSNQEDKLRALKKLQFEFNKALEHGWNPLVKETEKPTLENALLSILNDKLSSNLGELYKRNLKSLHRMFIKFLTQQELKGKADELGLERIEAFLNQFCSTERNYINRRRILGMFFNEIVRRDFGNRNVVKNTKPAKGKAVLHAPYTENQLRNVLGFLKANNTNLHLCCLMTYGCLLRPHQEIRLLKLKHIVKDFTEIHLSGSENKSKRVRTVYIPGYIQEVLRERLKSIKDMEANIFTLTREPYNPTYFNLMWLKARPKMIDGGILEPNQTIYSFRHTAAVNVYRKTKDLHILQQLLQHSNMIVTLNYLRGLGEMNDERLKEVLPELNI